MSKIRLSANPLTFLALATVPADPNIKFGVSLLVGLSVGASDLKGWRRKFGG